MHLVLSGVTEHNFMENEKNLSNCAVLMKPANGRDPDIVPYIFICHDTRHNVRPSTYITFPLIFLNSLSKGFYYKNS
jgi:hypothetical protein